MSETLSPSSGRRYGVQRVCRVWEVPRSTYYERRRPTGSRPRARPSPPSRSWLSDDELLTRIRGVLERAEKVHKFYGEGYRKVWARLRTAGTRTSKRRVLRMMREHGLLAPTRPGRRRGPQVHDGRITTDALDLMWGTDATAVWTRRQGLVTVFLVVDHFASELVGVHAAKKANRYAAMEALRNSVSFAYGEVSESVAVGLQLRHDHGSQFTSRAYQRELDFLGIESSPSFVRSPEGNGVSERMVRTLKEQCLWLRDFEDEADVLAALNEFRERYNNEWILGRHSYRSPAAMRAAHQTLARKAA